MIVPAPIHSFPRWAGGIKKVDDAQHRRVRRNGVELHGISGLGIDATARPEMAIGRNEHEPAMHEIFCPYHINIRCLYAFEKMITRATKTPLPRAARLNRPCSASDWGKR